MNPSRARVALVILLGASSIAARPEDAKEVLEKVRTAYASIKDAELHFSQRTKFSLSKLEQRGSGILYLKKDNKYRLETGDQTIVTDGNTVWRYSVSTNQVLVDNFKPSEGSLTPERILGGAPDDFTPALIGKERIGGNETMVLKLVPKNGEGLVVSLRLWVDTADWIVRKAEVTDANGKETTYTVSSIRTNIGLADSRFTLRIPEGAEVVDLR
jgi:chaperone LolA